MKRAVVGLMLAQAVMLMGLAGYVSVAVPGPAPVMAMVTPMEPPMSRMAGLTP
jgi:hypothetical protein